MPVDEVPGLAAVVPDGIFNAPLLNRCVSPLPETRTHSVPSAVTERVLGATVKMPVFSSSIKVIDGSEALPLSKNILSIPETVPETVKVPITPEVNWPIAPEIVPLVVVIFPVTVF